MSKSKRAKQKRAAGKSPAAMSGESATAVVDDPRSSASTQEVKPLVAPAWKLRLQAIGLRVGVYALYILGIYWIVAAWFSSWGETLWGCAGLTALGVGLLFAAMNVNTVDYSREELLRAAGKHNVREGALWCVGGIVLTRIGYLGYLPATDGGRYVVFTGAIMFGFLQLLQGYVQLQLAKRSKSPK